MKKNINTNGRKNTFSEVKITDMNNLGFGVARDDGKVVFVQHGVDGDTARVKIIKCTSGYDVARIEELLVPSPHRAESDCAVSGRCGGCIYRGITREHELELKKKTVEGAFLRAGLPDVKIGDVQSAEASTGYRNKLQLPVGTGKNGGTVMGYYAAHSHDIIPCDGCLLHPGEMNRIASFIRGYIDEAKWSAVRHLYMRRGTKPDGENNVTVCLVVHKRPRGIEAFADKLTAEFPAVSGVLLNYNTEDTNVILGDRFELISGVDYTCDRLCGIDFRISPASFYQVNHDAAELAYRLIAEKAELSPGDRLLDLYCGIGTIGLCTAAQADGVSLTGIEIIPSAVENARENAARGGFTVVSPEEIKTPAKDASERRACFICGDAGDADAGDYDVIIVDPPRKGCSAELIDKLAQFMRGGASRLVYMSCNPSTLARDVKMLLERGLEINGEVTPIDMFPGTGHVETVCLLSKLHAKQHIEINLDMDELDLTDAEKKATYQEIKDYVLEHSGLKVSSLYIAQVKQKCGIIERENYNKPKSEDARGPVDLCSAPTGAGAETAKQPQCPPNKEKAIKEALKHFGMI